MVLKTTFPKFKMILSALIAGLCIQSCGLEPDQKENPDVLTIDGKNYTRFETSTPAASGQTSTNLAINYYEIKDPNNGMTLTLVPLPGTWEQQNGSEFLFIGPGNMKIYGVRTGDFSYSDDPQQIYLFQTVGKKIQSPKTMDQAIQEYFVPELAKLNRRLMKTYPLPEAAAFLKKFNDLQYKIDMTPVNFEAVATEWEDPDGTSYLTIIIKHEEQGPAADSWGLTFDGIQSPKAGFENAKRTLINYMVNQEINMDWIRKVNGDLKYKIDASNAAHQKMMAEVKRNMEVFQEGQAQRRADREVIDNRISNYILGKSDVVDPQTATAAKVEAGSTYYWINEKGEYMSTESYSWDPNQHEPYKKYNTWTRYQLNQ